MAAFRLASLLQWGIVLGLSHARAEWPAARESQSGVGWRRPPQPLSASRSPGSEAGERVAMERVAMAFLRSGNPGDLKRANCTRRHELLAARRGAGSPGGGAHHHHRAAEGDAVVDTVVHAANFLNMMLQANRSREQSLRRDIDWYHGLVRSILEGDPKIHRAVVAFNSTSPEGPAVVLQATRAGGEIVLQDLSTVDHHRHPPRDGMHDTDWLRDLRHRKMPHFHKRVLSQDFTSVDNSLRRGESFIPDRTNIRWSAPYLECQNGHFVPRWLATLSAGFFGLNANLEPEFRGVVRADINLQDVDIDQCSSDGWFARSHDCNLTTMECLHFPGKGFVLDNYQCPCRRGFYHPNRVPVNELTSEGGAPPSDACRPCQAGCAHCVDNSACVAREPSPLRLAVLAFQGVCMLLLLASMVLVYHLRRNKGVRASGLVLLETILCGALLLYFPVVILFFQPSVFRCILLRWVRLLGFSTVYGTLTLKLYRVLKVFLSRTAQRVPYMTSWRVLRLLGVILLVVVWFLLAWTSAVCQTAGRQRALISVGFTPERLQFSLCLVDRWDYMTAVAEFLFLLWSVYLCFAVRSVPSAFHEPRYMACAVHNELVLSAIFYVVRFSLAEELHPDWMLLLFFAHTHLTVTVTLGLLLVPKFLFTMSHLRDDIASEAYEDEMDMGRSGSYLNSSITSAWSEHSLDPEDIREELKKLYSQLEIYKRKKMLANNPHLQKKRSSKKGLGRSLMRRITEIPESVHRQCSRDDKDPAEHGSNRNSVCVLRKNPFEPAHPPSKTQAREESLKSKKVFSLKKSHSSYDHVRDAGGEAGGADTVAVAAAEGSLLDALMGKKLARRRSNDKMDAVGEPAESAPLVCKSASAHNLTADKRPLHPRTSMLQKSLSVIASAKEKTLGLAAKNAEDGTKRGTPKSRDVARTPTADPEEEEERPPKMMSSQSVEYKQTAAKAGIMKPQASSGSQPSVCSDPAKSKELYDLSEVCPWELEDLPTCSENKVQKHVSIAPKETTTHHGAGTKGGKPPQQQQQKTPGLSPSNPRNSKEIPAGAAERSDMCPWEGRRGAEEDPSGELQTSGPTSRMPGQPRPQTSRADVCPWDAEEAPAPDGAPHSQETSGRKKPATQAEGMVGNSAYSHPSKTTSSLKTSTARADICPWESTARADLCPWESDADAPESAGVARPARSPARSPPAPGSTDPPRSRQGGARPSRTPETGRVRERSRGSADGRVLVEARDRGKPSLEKHTSRPGMAEGAQNLHGAETLKNVDEGPARGRPAEVRPRDDPALTKDRSDSPIAKKKNSPKSKGKALSSPKKADVCPWDFDDSPGKKA